jgi:aspartyl-tRNA(Asn)/glutamyl-tRNA(Gln) amidotransferase subunit A
VDPEKLTAAETAKAVSNREISARELTNIFLSRCTEFNRTLNSFIHIFEDEALRQADAVDETIRRGEKLLPLAGVPVAVKDNICYREGPTTCGAAALKEYRPPYTAAAVQKLIDAGAVIVGKTNLDQFDLGNSTISSFAGPTANPWNIEKPPVDGTAAAVAAGQCLLALGSDTGGSLSIGASRCGLFGLIPTTGLVSRHGLITISPSFARVGITAREAADSYLALKVISGYDPRDSATAAAKAGLPAMEDKVLPQGLKIGFPADLLDLTDAATRSAMEKAGGRFVAGGAKYTDIALPFFQEALRAYYVITTAEASSNLGRFDGIRFGAFEEGSNLEEWYAKTRGKTFGEEAKRRSVIGAYLLCKDSFERYYRQAQKVWNLVRHSFYTALESCDLMVLPAVTAPAGAKSEGKGFLDIYGEELFCAPISLSGLPTISIPAGEADGLPIGLQLVGKPSSEALLCELAARSAEPFKLPPAGGF